MKLIVGLGNPGKEYENTRHNVGFMVIDNFKNLITNEEYKTKFNGSYIMTSYNNEKIMLLKPLSYMNLSGEVVRKFVDYFNIELDDILIIYDDMDFDLGILKIKKSGSSGGHNGIKNIIKLLNTEDIKRIRIGISKGNINSKDYVLGRFSKDELNKIKEVINQTESILKDYLSIDFDKLMNKYN